MSFNFPAFLIAAFFCLPAATGATAGEVVYFQSASVPPTPLMQRLAKEHGEIAHGEPGVMIAGEMLRPAGDGPFPTLVILHGCGGLSPITGQIRAERYVAWGYVVLQFDSFAARGIESGLGKTCLNIPAVDRPLDAIGALDFLAQLPFVDPGRIAVVGFSLGGTAALAAIDANDAAILSANRFTAAVLYYPSTCPMQHHDLVAPVLVLMGDRDDWVSLRDCRAELAARRSQQDLVRLIVYHGASHDFDIVGIKDHPMEYGGRHLEYSEPADLAAQSEMRSFLMQVLHR
jgi:dienelactone hydrolase